MTYRFVVNNLLRDACDTLNRGTDIWHLRLHLSGTQITGQL